MSNSRDLWHLFNPTETTEGEKSKEGTPTFPAKPAKPTADEIRAAQEEMRKTLEAKKNASKMKTELLQKKQELLEKQIKEQKVWFRVVFVCTSFSSTSPSSTTVKPCYTGPMSNGNPPIANAKPRSLQAISFLFLYW